MPSNILKSRSSKSFNIQSSIKSFLILMKPRVMSLVIFTCAVGYLISNPSLDTYNAITSIFLVAIGAGASACLNMWYDSDIDALMTRTCLRPIPTGKISKNNALIYGIFLTTISVFGLNYFSNTLSAILLLSTILFYLFVYTIWLKRKTPQNIVIGGAAGALPPVIGWTISANTISVEPIILFLIIFFWTPSHFWALSLYKADDYKKANVPMMPIFSGIEKTKLYILVYSLIMLPLVSLPYLLKFSGLLYFIPTMILTLYYNFICYELFKFKKNKFESKIAKKVFGYSIFYLFLIFLLILIDHSF